jgi:hypothetical protein
MTDTTHFEGWYDKTACGLSRKPGVIIVDRIFGVGASCKRCLRRRIKVMGGTENGYVWNWRPTKAQPATPEGNPNG